MESEGNGPLSTPQIMHMHPCEWYRMLDYNSIFFACAMMGRIAVVPSAVKGSG